MNAAKISVKARLFATLALTAVLTIGVGVLGLSGTKSSNGDLDSIFSNRFMPTGWVGEMQSAERELLTRAEDVVIRQDAAGIKATLGELDAREAHVKELWAKLEATELTDKERVIVQQFGGF